MIIECNKSCPDCAFNRHGTVKVKTWKLRASGVDLRTNAGDFKITATNNDFRCFFTSNQGGETECRAVLDVRHGE